MILLAELALVAAVAGLILWPLLRPPAPAARERADPAQEAARAKAAAFSALRELEFDFATGKLSPDDYARLRARYEARAVEALHPRSRPAPEAETALEQEIRAARARRRCPACGQRRPPGARFCPSCGRPAMEEGAP